MRQLLHDPSGLYWSTADLTAYLNSGMQERDLLSGINRNLYTLTLTAGTATYNFTTVGNASIFDVVGITVRYGNLQVQLDQVSYTVLLKQYQPWTTYQYVPRAFARQGHSSVVLGPAPASAYVSVWDCCVYSPALVAGTDADPVPYPYTECVPYFAAYMAKLNERQIAEAQHYFERFQQHLGIAQSARVGLSPVAYPRR